MQKPSLGGFEKYTISIFIMDKMKGNRRKIEGYNTASREVAGRGFAKTELLHEGSRVIGVDGKLRGNKIILMDMDHDIFEKDGSRVERRQTKFFIVSPWG